MKIREKDDEIKKMAKNGTSHKSKDNDVSNLVIYDNLLKNGKKLPDSYHSEATYCLAPQLV
ncbi:hypothetical protein BpHYR1_033738 [Brachionus plicatilis]|uniref:Uncharacterized protein n=1 Tax=Brachionus plicatilis TaxID=10195 RepID=A0A3M7QFE2_BRAPC|nr:hypothetical protein BpHYR1_033738 [Brachionus plicatilis]